MKIIYYRSPPISICEKSMLVELSRASAPVVLVLVFVLDGEDGGCLMAKTLQLRLFVISLWAIASLSHMNKLNTYPL